MFRAMKVRPPTLSQQLQRHPAEIGYSNFDQGVAIIVYFRLRNRPLFSADFANKKEPNKTYGW